MKSGSCMTIKDDQHSGWIDSSMMFKATPTPMEGTASCMLVCSQSYSAHLPPKLPDYKRGPLLCRTTGNMLKPLPQASCIGQQT